MRPTLFTLLLSSLTACGFSTGPGPGDYSLPDSGPDPSVMYQALQTQLEQGRSQFLSTSEGATELAGVSSQLYWLEFPGYDPTLHRYDDSAGKRIDYGFSVGTGDAYNFQASPSLVVTALNDGNGNVVFSAYDATQPNQLVGTATVPAPADEENWWTYSVDGSTVYYAITGSGPATLYSWAPANGGVPAQKAILGNTIPALNALGVVGNDCGFIDLAGEVWFDDLSTGMVTQLGNTDQANGFSLVTSGSATGILYTTDSDVFFYTFATSQTQDLGTQLLTATCGALCTNYPGAQAYSTDATLWQDSMIYVGQVGVFQLDLATGTVTPLLLNALDESVTYRYPTPLDDGSLYTVGLESDDGATGADGPVFKTSLK